MDRPGLGRLIRDHKSAILDAWERRVRETDVAHDLPRPLLYDSMPELLDRLAGAAEDGADAGKLGESATEHAQQRLELGYDIAELVAEYAALRVTLVDVLCEHAPDVPIAGFRQLNRVIEAAVCDVTSRFSSARERKLRALERISTETLRGGSLDEMLRSTIDVLAEAVPDVDEVTILLREGNELQVRASRGLQQEVDRGFCVSMGEGFAGKVAATRAPVFLRDATSDPLVKSDVIRESRLHALYGVPLVDGGEVFGVIHMGSRTAQSFPKEDLLLFGSLANRVATIVATQRTMDRERAIDELRDRFIGMLAHDLVQPINAVLNSVRLVQARGQLDDVDRKAIDRVARMTERMSRLVHDVVDFTRARLAGGIPVDVSWVDLAELVRNVCDEAHLANPGRVVELRLALRSRVCCDADRIAQCLSNLVSNALKHGDPGGRVVVGAEESPSDAIIVVKNEGAPIPSRLLPLIFDPFRRGEDDTRSGSGLGLGLYIAKAIVIAHGGSVEVLSDAAEGTRFVVRLPRKARARAA
ncbi:MAG TPA: ATP-binding protein [Polyangiaceae bacterium]